jgi:signal transduction histidine kinase/CheY-like chemotaxis protein
VTEEQRLEALRRYDLPDLPAEPELEAVLRVAATVTGVPTATMNLLDAAVQCQYVTAGFEGSTSPRSDAMCEVTFREGRSQHVPDARLDPRFAANPWVDGRTAQVRFYAAAPLVTPDGFTLGTLCVFDDVPKELTAAQRSALDDLAGQVVALLERRRLARVAQHATAAKSAFLAAVSHEIRTPMNGVLGMLGLLLATPLDDGQRRHAELAQRSAETLLALLDDVLDLSKGEAGHVVLSERPFDPVDLARDVVDVLSALAVGRGTTLQVEVRGPVPELVGDPGRLRQVLVNLVGNALKFTVVGGVTVQVAHDDGWLQIAVADTGEGIAAEELSTLFSAFQQGASGRRHGGTGLGLVICKELVELMGGALGVESEVGVGTTFTVRVPLPTAGAQEPADLEGLKVLVVDDGEVNRMVAVGLLEVLGASADAVPSGDEALTRAQQAAYDVILLDHVMPGLDGPATARALREAGVAARLVGLTGTTLPEDLAACRAAGMQTVLTKPLRPEDLLAALG